MIEALSYTFIQNAILAGLLVSIAVGVIGTLVVVNKSVFIAGSIAHASYGGIAMALYFGIPFLLGTSIFSVFVAIIVAYFYIKQDTNMDAIIGALWAFGMAVGVVFVDLKDGYNVDLLSYLFGSILSVSRSDLMFMGILDLIIIGFVVVFYPLILAVSFDKDYAKIKGANVNLFSVVEFILIALAIVLSIKSVGLILIIALLTIPVYIAQSFNKTLKSVMITSGILSFAFILLGLILSYNLDLTSGASIILVASFVFGIFFATKRIFA